MYIRQVGDLSHGISLGFDYLSLCSIGKDIAYSTYADFHSFGVDVYTLAYDQKHGAPQTKLFSDRVKILKKSEFFASVQD